MNVKFNSLKVIGILVLVLCGSVFGQEDTKNNKDKTSRSNATVNPTSLGLELSIPLGNVPGRAGSSTPIVLNYSSKLWQTDKYRINLPSPAEYVNAIYGDQSDSGWTTNLQAIYFEDSTISRFTISNGNGGSSGGGTVRAGSCCHPKLPVLDCDHTCEPQTTISSSATNTFSYDVIPRYTVHFPDGSTHDLVNSLIPFHVAA